MKCEWTVIGIPDWRGKRVVRCSRCGMTLHPTASPLSRIRAICFGWPRWWEFGNWVDLALAIIGINQSRVNWLLVKLWLADPKAMGCQAKILWTTCDERKAWLNSLGGRLAAWWLKRWIRS